MKNFEIEHVRVGKMKNRYIIQSILTGAKERIQGFPGVEIENRLRNQL